MRRGQTETSQVIVFILALMIGSLVLILGYISLQKILKASGEAEMMTFQSDLESTLKSLSYGSTRKKALAVPGDYPTICFADLSYLKGQGKDNFDYGKEYAVVRDSIFSGVESNVFLMPDGTESFNVGDLDVWDGFKCFDLSAGHAEVGFEGMGNRTRVLPYEEDEEEIEPEPTEQCGDGICDSNEGCELCEKDCHCQEKYSCKQNKCVPDECVPETFVLIDEVHSSGVSENPPSGWSTAGSQNCIISKNWAGDSIGLHPTGDNNYCKISRSDHLPPEPTKALTTYYFHLTQGYSKTFKVGVRNGKHSATFKHYFSNLQERIFYVRGPTGEDVEIACPGPSFAWPFELWLTTDWETNTFDIKYSQAVHDCVAEVKGIPMKLDSEPSALVIEGEGIYQHGASLPSVLIIRKVQASYEVPCD